MFSCCCAAVDQTWSKLCPCADLTTMKCDASCWSATADFPDSYFRIAVKIHAQVQLLHPAASIWFTGHSLGGAVASVAALETGSPAVTFEAPGDLQYAQRVGFDITELAEEHNVYHFGLASDPLFVGQCQGKLSPCYLAGYAIETRCHTGQSCFLDGQDEIKLDILNHRISRVIERIAELGKSGKMDVRCETQAHSHICSDCEAWTYSSRWSTSLFNTQLIE